MGMCLNKSMSEFSDVRSDIGYGPSNEETNKKLRALKAKQESTSSPTPPVKPEAQLSKEEQQDLNRRGIAYVRANMKLNRGEELTPIEQEIIDNWPKQDSEDIQ